jgi:butyryl-CoA dehydrogenase
VSSALIEDVHAFAASVAGAAERYPVDDHWKPGEHADDRNPALRDAIYELGWGDVATDPELLPFVAPAALELGRRFAALDLVDATLGGALVVEELARYADGGAPVVAIRGDELVVRTAVRLTAVGYIDALAVHAVDATEGETVVTGAEAAGRRDAWMAANLGYLAGVASEAVRLATEHAKARQAFGRPLAALDPIQQHLATAATLADGICLLAGERVSAAGLAHAGEAASQATALCQQVVGAIGYTLEFPLQRAFRRARAVRLWADAVLAPRAAGAPA